MANKAPVTVTRLDQREIDAKVRELQDLEFQRMRLAIATARSAKHRSVELASERGLYSIFVEAVNRVANEEHVRDVKFHSYWRLFAHDVESEGGRVTLVLDIDKGK